MSKLDRMIEARTERGFSPMVREARAKVRELFTEPKQQPKGVKGEAEGYATYILHLAPSDLSGYQTCPKASAGCRAACLNTSGQGGMFKRPRGCNAADYVRDNLDKVNSIQRARIGKTHLYFEDRPAFLALLVHEIALAIKREARSGLTPVFRLNGTSDIQWETEPVPTPQGVAVNVFAAFPDVQFYDYTKIANRRVAGIKNYSLTFSLCEDNDSDAREAIRSGLNVAVVFRSNSRKKEPLPERWAGLRVIDADKTDLRFLDPRGVICGLRAKGEALKDTSGFVREIRGGFAITLPTL